MGPHLVPGVDFFLLLEVLLVLAVGVLFGLAHFEQLAVEGSSPITNHFGVLLDHALLVAEQLLQHLLFVYQFQRDLILILKGPARLHEVEEHGADLFGHEGNAPLEHVDEVGEQVGVRVFQELLDVESVVLSAAPGTLNFITAPLLL